MTETDEAAFLDKQAAGDGSLMIAAFLGGELVGTADINRVRDITKLRHRAELGIALKKKYWGKGIGALLMQELLSEAEKAGYEQLELSVFSGNKRAIRMYESFGFERWGTIKHAGKLRNGEYADEIIMGIFLRV